MSLSTTVPATGLPAARAGSGSRAWLFVRRHPTMVAGGGLILAMVLAALAAPLPPAKHVFTHKIWELGGWRGTAPACALPDGYVWAAPEDLAEVYPVPNAFGAYVKAK